MDVSTVEKSLSKSISKHCSNCKTAEREYNQRKWLNREAKYKAIKVLREAKSSKKQSLRNSKNTSYSKV
jgi:hypothetical protein